MYLFIYTFAYWWVTCYIDIYISPRNHWEWKICTQQYMGSGQLALELLAPLERWVKKWVVKNGFWLPCMQNGVDNIAATIFFFFPHFLLSYHLSNSSQLSPSYSRYQPEMVQSKAQFTLQRTTPTNGNRHICQVCRISVLTQSASTAICWC